MRPNNSFKPTPCRGIGHVLYATLAHVRRPATGRLNSGVRRQKSFLQICCSQAYFTGFGRQCSSDRLSARCRFVQVCRARSIFTCAFRLLASKTMFVCCSFCSAGPAPSETAGGKFAGRAHALPLRLSASVPEASTPSASHPPNNSFKPTPRRGIGHVLCATLARVRRPATGRLNSGVRPLWHRR
jgi:hypothetical protein